MENLNQSQAPQPEVVPSSSSVLPAVLITAVVTAIIVGAGTYYFMSTGTMDEQIQVTPAPDDTGAIERENESMSSGEAEDSDSETYANTTIGFSIQLPDNWSVRESSANGYPEAMFFDADAPQTGGTGNGVGVARFPSQQAFGEVHGGATVGAGQTTLSGMSAHVYVKGSNFGSDERVTYVRLGDEFIVVRRGVFNTSAEDFLSTFVILSVQ